MIAALAAVSFVFSALPAAAATIHWTIQGTIQDYFGTPNTPFSLNVVLVANIPYPPTSGNLSLTLDAGGQTGTGTGGMAVIGTSSLLLLGTRTITSGPSPTPFLMISLFDDDGPGFTTSRLPTLAELAQIDRIVFKNGSGNDVTSTDFSISQSIAVPLPAAVPLFLTGIGALGLVRYRKRRRTAATG